MRGSRGGQAVRPPPQIYSIYLQYWSGSLKNNTATKPAFNVWPSSTRQRNAIWILPPPHQLKEKNKNVIKFGPPLKNFLDPRMLCTFVISCITRMLIEFFSQENNYMYLAQEVTYTSNNRFKDEITLTFVYVPKN